MCYFCIHLQLCCNFVDVVKCSNEGQLRLVGGNNTREGRVEVCFGETWATICDAFWSTADANVVCQQLGYSSNGTNVTVFMYEYKFLTDILQFSRDTSD